MLNFVQSFIEFSLLEKFLLLSVLCFWMLPLIFFARSKMKMRRSHQEIDNKISVLEDICDRADIRISKLKYELNNLGEKKSEDSKLLIQKEEVGLPTYQDIIRKIQSGKTMQETSQETGVSTEELEVLYKLIETSSSSQK